MIPPARPHHPRLSRRHLLVAACLPSLPPATLAQVRDEILLPPPERQALSPDGRYRLQLSTPDPSRPVAVQATLAHAQGGAWRQVWSQPLPHEYGPRLLLVSDGGAVLLVDEWINTLTSRALVILDPQGRLQRQYSAEDVISLLARPRATVARHARLGPWLSAEPQVQAGGDIVLLSAAGRVLKVQLRAARVDVLPAH